LKHYASPQFWACYHRLPENVRAVADRNFQILKLNSKHPSLHFKKVGRFWSARVGIAHRALAVETQDGVLWFWIGSHADYDKFIG